MKLTYHFVLVVFCVSVTSTSVYSNLRENLLSYLSGIQKSRHPERSRQVEEAQPGVDGTNQNDQNPTLLEFVRVDPNPKSLQVQVKSEPTNDEEQLAIDPNVQKLEDINVDNNHFQLNQDIGIDIEKVTERDERWVSKDAPVQNYFNLNQAVQGPKFSQLHLSVDAKDAEMAKIKAKILRNAKKHEDRVNTNIDLPKIEAGPKVDTQYFHMDPVLNLLRSQSFRRSDSDSGSSERDLKDWQDEFRDEWMHKKYEALNQSRPKGDNVNMVAARPWGVQCGDPAQHDMPWGSCMLAMECEPEFRVYRGDYFCGRSEFVCCSLQVTTYDMYQGFDVSFDDKSMSTDTEEKKAQQKSSAEQKAKKAAKSKAKRKEERNKRIKKIKRAIKKITKEITKILNKVYKNGTRERKKKTNQLKKFIKKLKKQFKKDRQSVKDLHHKTMVEVDNKLLLKLNQIREVNKKFMDNATFREIVVNGTMTKQGARMLLEAYPELDSYLTPGRRAAPRSPQDDELEYDIEYGYMYY